MMKKLVKLLSLVLVASMLLVCLASCDASGSIKKAYEEAGYEVKILSAEDDDVRAILLLLEFDEEEIEDMEDYEFIFCTKDFVKTALIIKFPNAGELKDFLIVEEDGEKDDSAFRAAEDAGKINGNCLLIYGVLGGDEPFAK